MIREVSPARCSDLVELLRWRACNAPETRGYLFLQSGEADGPALTYGALDERARAIGAALEARVSPGARVLLVFPSGLDFVSAFFGCLYAGALAVPAYPPMSGRHLPRLQSIVRDSQAACALSTTSILATIRAGAAQVPALSELPWITVDDLPDDAASAWKPPASGPRSLAMLQYTSGSTGDPRGVMVSHENLLHNSALIHRWLDRPDGEPGVTWLPPYHDMGLIGGILQPLYAGFLAVMMAPFAFLQRPIRWLRAISRFRASVSGAPNFAYDLCVQKIGEDEAAGLDLSCWTAAFCGAEPIHAGTVERFVRAFEPFGFRREAFLPCYGLAEATLIVSGTSKLGGPHVGLFHEAALETHRAAPASPGAPDARALVSCGPPARGVTVRIVDPETRTPCATGEVGEIWVAGEAVAAGYWGRAEETHHTFGARLEPSGEGPFLRTGDLGFLWENELYVAGRLKDLIILGGLNYYPQDIELAAEQSHASVRPGGCAAFAVAGDGEEALVVVAEVKRDKGAGGALDEKAIKAAIRRAVAEQYSLHARDVLLVQPGVLPRTSSGKLQRRASKDAYTRGTLGRSS